MAKKTYEVKSNLDHNGKAYKPGDTVELDEEKAKEIPWAVEEPKTAGKKTTEAPK